MAKRVPIPKGATIGPPEPQTVPIPKGATIDYGGPGSYHGASGSWKPLPREQTATASDLLRALAPGFVQAHPTLAGIGGAMGNIAQGAGRELIGQAGRLANYISPAGGKAIEPTIKKYGTPIPGWPETVGRMLLDTGEFFAPGGVEGKAAKGIAGAIPGMAGKIASLAPGAASMGAISGLQGGSPLTGALMGAGGGLMGKLAEHLAPKLAESALNMPNTARAFGKTPGRAIMRETSGITPSAVLDSAHEAMDDIGSKLGSYYREAGNQGKTVSLRPALDILGREAEKAAQARNAELADALRAKMLRLATDANGDINITDLHPYDLWTIKQGQGQITNWNPNIDPKVAARIDRELYGAIKEELNRAVPEARPFLQRYSSLKPVALRANIESRNAGIVQSSLGRFARHTGALASTLAGGYAGEREGGVPGMIAGGLAGTLAPELIANPSTQLMMARYGPGLARALPKAALGMYHGLTSKGAPAVPIDRSMLRSKMKNP